MPGIPELFTSWGFWYAVGAAVVVVAATLLIAILLVARSIAAHATRALEAARRIEENTKPIWALADALDTLVTIRRVAGSVAEKAGLLAGVLHGGGKPAAR